MLYSAWSVPGKTTIILDDGSPARTTGCLVQRSVSAWTQRERESVLLAGPVHGTDCPSGKNTNNGVLVYQVYHLVTGPTGSHHVLYTCKQHYCTMSSRFDTRISRLCNTSSVCRGNSFLRQKVVNIYMGSRQSKVLSFVFFTSVLNAQGQLPVYANFMFINDAFYDRGKTFPLFFVFWMTRLLNPKSYEGQSCFETWQFGVLGP